VLSVPKR
jgi:hypothetical protein